MRVVVDRVKSPDNLELIQYKMSYKEVKGVISGALAAV